MTKKLLTAMMPLLVFAALAVPAMAQAASREYGIRNSKGEFVALDKATSTGASFGCPASRTVLGEVTGKFIGHQAAGSSKLVFTNADGLWLAGTYSMTITGSDETLDGTLPVYIN